MTIESSTQQDIQTILKLYDYATAYQQKMKAILWPSFTQDQIEQEIINSQQWKICIDGDIACVWMTTFEDPFIWEERNKDPSVYIHRIATNPNYRGRNFVKHIVDWAKTYAQQHHKQYIRLDTAGNNEKLIAYYTRCGFNFLGANPLKETSNLPQHYHNTPVCLFEMEVES